MARTGSDITAILEEPRSAGSEADERDIAAAQRDPAAFAPVFHRYWPLVYRYCALRLACPADAEDVASQIFVRALANLHAFDPRSRGAFRRWLFTIAHHEVASRYRYHARHPAIPLDDSHERLATAESSPEQVAITAADAAHLVALVRELPPRLRDVVELRLAGLTDREIAGVLGISGPAVRKAQSRALAHLRHQFGVAMREEHPVHG
jgi:RNA polymerase sigma-70 factor (ECF subfamily)